MTLIENHVALKSLWRRYKDADDRFALEQLIIAYTPVVKRVAARVAQGLPQHVTERELFSYGLQGLARAIERFELDRSVKFETYAKVRIKGAILDELRSLDWVPRSIRSEAREIEKTQIGLANRLQRKPTEDEIAAELGVSPGEVNASLQLTGNTVVVALDAPRSFGDSFGDEGSMIDRLADPGAVDPQHALDGVELKSALIEAVGRLPERERIIIALYYFKNLTLKEIGAKLGVTESRVSQIHTQALRMMRSGMRYEAA